MRFTARKKRLAHKNKRQKKNFSRLRLIVFSIIALVIAGFALNVFRMATNSTIWSQSRAGIVFHTDPAIFLLLNQETDEIVAVSIPTDAYVEIPRGFGSYRFNAAWQLGDFEGISGQLFAETTEELLAVPTQGWIGFGAEPLAVSQDSTLEALRVLKGKLASKSFWLGVTNASTNLSLLDRVRLSVQLAKIPVEEIDTLTIHTTSAISEIELADKSKVSAIDTKRLDTYLAPLFEDIAIRQERFTIEILNATNRASLGSRAERMVKQLGGRVIRVGNADEKTDACVLKGSEEIESSTTVAVFGSVFNCSFVAVREDSENREDVQIVLGENYAEKILGKKSF